MRVGRGGEGHLDHAQLGRLHSEDAFGQYSDAVCSAGETVAWLKLRPVAQLLPGHLDGELAKLVGLNGDDISIEDGKHVLGDDL